MMQQQPRVAELEWCGRTLVWETPAPAGGGAARLLARHLEYRADLGPLLGSWRLGTTLGAVPAAAAAPGSTRLYEHSLRRRTDGSRVVLLTHAERPPTLGPARRPHRVLCAALTLCSAPSVCSDADAGALTVDVSAYLNERAESFVCWGEDGGGAETAPTLHELVAMLRKAPRFARALAAAPAPCRARLRVMRHDLSEVSFESHDAVVVQRQRGGGAAAGGMGVSTAAT
jgi:hypothetical protein